MFSNLMTKWFGEWQSNGAYSNRSYLIQAYKMVYSGDIYDCLEYDFYTEAERLSFSGGFKPIPIEERRPCVRSSLAKVVVDDSASLLFGVGHFPNVRVNDNPNNHEFLTDIISTCKLNKVMLDAAIIGSTGSVCVFVTLVESKPHFWPRSTEYMTPIYDPQDPRRLIKVIEKYKVNTKKLIQEYGYTDLDQDVSEHWMMTELTTEDSIVYLPFPVDPKNKEKPKVDKKRSVNHGWGFCPAVWIKNLPTMNSNDIDGMCTFKVAIDTIITIDYQLSQGTRALKYSCAPLLVIKDNKMQMAPSQTLSRGGDAALVIDERGGAELLEVNGTAAKAVIDYVQYLREVAIESMHGNRVRPEKMSSVQSGRAMELMNQPLVWLADRLRGSYGEYGLVKLLEICLMMNETAMIRTRTNKYAPGYATSDWAVELDWPSFYEPTEMDLMQQATALSTLTTNELLSRETALRSLSSNYGIGNVQDEAELIEQDERHEEAELHPQVKEQIKAGI